MIKIEILAETEYQDLYRVKDGVLLVVNKFEPDKHYIHKQARPPYNAKRRLYDKNTQKKLQILNENSNSFTDIVILKDTVLYDNLPVRSTDDISKWMYQIDVKDENFFGSSDDILAMLGKISDTISYYKSIIHSPNVGYSPFDD